MYVQARTLEQLDEEFGISDIINEEMWKKPKEEEKQVCRIIVMLCQDTHICIVHPCTLLYMNVCLCVCVVCVCVCACVHVCV